ncbi:MAG TPA: hypothetical protein VFW12_04575 [Candidatus Limnocylindria bacterium]|nr:hypothetical protein [Candidatus Limnocylindria bacterium]
MEPRTYLRAVDAAVRDGLPAALGPVQHQNRGWQAKWWFGNPALHYESTPRVRASVIEIGLHFEADELTNALLFAAFRARAKAIARRLGEVRIEEWDRGWARVWEPVALTEPLGARNGTAVGERIAAYVAVLEPILRDELPADVEWSPTPAAAPRRRPRARSR